MKEDQQAFSGAGCVPSVGQAAQLPGKTTSCLVWPRLCCCPSLPGGELLRTVLLLRWGQHGSTSPPPLLCLTGTSSSPAFYTVEGLVHLWRENLSLLNWSSGEVAFRHLFLTSEYINGWIITVDGKFPADLSETWLKSLIRNPVEQMETAWFQWAVGEAARGYSSSWQHHSSLASLFLAEMHSF